MRAIAYTREFIIAQTGEVVSPGSQMELIQRCAAEKGMEIVAWFTDGRCEEDLLKRPGIQALLGYDQPYEIVLCARTWALARSMAALEPLFKELDRRQVEVESAVPAWDLLSQQCRRRSKSLPVLPHYVRSGGYRVAKPVRLNFVHLVHPAHPSISPRL